MTSIIETPVEAPALTDLTVADVLQLAADYIEVRGHTKGSWSCKTGAVCAVGALTLAATGKPWPDGALSPLVHAAVEAMLDELDIIRLASTDWGDVAAWNDEEARTPEQVVAALRSAASDARL